MAKRKRGITGNVVRKRNALLKRLRRAQLKEEQNKSIRTEIESSIEIKLEPLDDFYEVLSGIQEKQDETLPLQTDLQLQMNRKTSYLSDSSVFNKCTQESSSGIKIKTEPLDDSYQASPEIQGKQDERLPLQTDVQLQMNRETSSSALKKHTDKLGSRIEIKLERLDDSYYTSRRTRSSSIIEKKQDERLPLQTDLRLKMNRKTNSASEILPSSSPKKYVNVASLNKRTITGPSPEHLREKFPSILKKVLNKPGPKCKTQLHTSVVDKKVPDGPPLNFPKQETSSFKQNLQNYPVLLPKQPETSVAQRNLQNSPVMLPAQNTVSNNPQNTVDNNNRAQSFLIIITTDKGSSNQTNIQESSNVSQDKQNSLPIVSRPFQESSDLKEDQLKTAESSKNNLDSGKSSKTEETDNNLNGDIQQMYSPELRNSLSQRNLKFEESIIELAKKQILEEISKSSPAESADLLFLRSLLPYISKIPESHKLRFRKRIQEVVDEFVTNHS